MDHLPSYEECLKENRTAYCPHCENYCEVQINHNVPTEAWVMFFIMILLCAPLCWLPFLVYPYEITLECKRCANIF